MATLIKVENNHSDIIKSRLALSVSIKGNIKLCTNDVNILKSLKSPENII